MNEPDEPLEMINIKFDTNDDASKARAVTQMAKMGDPMQLAALVVFATDKMARAELYARRLEALFIAFGAILGGALAVSVYYNIT
jgi:hypothetical protein